MAACARSSLHPHVQHAAWCITYWVSVEERLDLHLAQPLTARDTEATPAAARVQPLPIGTMLYG